MPHAVPGRRRGAFAYASRREACSCGAAPVGLAHITAPRAANFAPRSAGAAVGSTFQRMAAQPVTVHEAAARAPAVAARAPAVAARAPAVAARASASLLSNGAPPRAVAARRATELCRVQPWMRPGRDAIYERAGGIGERDVPRRPSGDDLLRPRRTKQHRR
jgi:hypothetical protein